MAIQRRGFSNFTSPNPTERGSLHSHPQQGTTMSLLKWRWPFLMVSSLALGFNIPFQPEQDSFSAKSSMISTVFFLPASDGKHHFLQAIGWPPSLPAQRRTSGSFFLLLFYFHFLHALIQSSFSLKSWRFSWSQAAEIPAKSRPNHRQG